VFHAHHTEFRNIESVLSRVGKKVGGVDFGPQEVDGTPAANAEHRKFAGFGIAQIGIERKVFVAWRGSSTHINAGSRSQFYKRVAVGYHERTIVFFIQRAFDQGFHARKSTQLAHEFKFFLVACAQVDIEYACRGIAIFCWKGACEEIGIGDHIRVECRYRAAGSAERGKVVGVGDRSAFEAP